jgi:hypothetical protein
MSFIRPEEEELRRFSTSLFLQSPGGARSLLRTRRRREQPHHGPEEEWDHENTIVDCDLIKVRHSIKLSAFSWG